ncbi:MAG: CYTH domain-containing protein [Rudaea sp.]|uniref:CYTH domain-containing protein n=1 Tax=unclassified Rudaea TaxID=2627037 RepID=UPI0010FA1D59|nr:MULTISPECIES: CYTH domain-containing protein [unclassified Rudaea]MBN8884683.1 CYTH domain-containing protein [Rudaea sp.]MBR0344991.1 CYTH domain-containing protein [Rudaea sp.]
MAIEIERKFLVTSDAWRAQATRAQRMVQGYLIDASLVATQTGTRCSLRVRIGGDKAWLNIKSATLGVARQEYDYPIPVADAERMLRDFCNGVVEKVRHYVPHAGLMFEVDEFFGDNADLVVAEVELQSADQAIAKPEWLGREVSEHLRYYNLNLLQYPYSRWSERERAGE